MTTGRLCHCAAVLATLASLTATAGDLIPPGAPAPTANPSEARIPITGIPISIEEPGSYYLTGNLTLEAGSSADGITVHADDVTIDLNGFTLAAQDASSGSGVLSLAGSRTAVMNGTIMGWGGHGVGFEGVDGCTVRGISAVNNGGAGIRVEEDFLIFDCRAAGNGEEGIRTGLRGALRDCVALENGDQNFSLGGDLTGENLVSERNRSGSGFATGSNITLIGCRSAESAFSGFSLGFRNTLIACQSYDNQGSGFFSQAGAIFENCTADNNEGSGINTSATVIVRGCLTRSNEFDGIRTSGSSVIEDCVASVNGRHGFRIGSNSLVTGCDASNNGTNEEGVGFEFFSGCRIEGNHAIGNDAGFQAAPLSTGQTEDCVVIRNTAIDNTINYAVSTTFNTVGVLITAHGSVTSSSAWANFSH